MKIANLALDLVVLSLFVISISIFFMLDQVKTNGAISSYIAVGNSKFNINQKTANEYKALKSGVFYYYNYSITNSSKALVKAKEAASLFNINASFLPAFYDLWFDKLILEHNISKDANAQIVLSNEEVPTWYIPFFVYSILLFYYLFADSKASKSKEFIAELIAGISILALLPFALGLDEFIISAIMLSPLIIVWPFKKVEKAWFAIGGFAIAVLSFVLGYTQVFGMFIVMGVAGAIGAIIPIDFGGLGRFAIPNVNALFGGKFEAQKK